MLPLDTHCFRGIEKKDLVPELTKVHDDFSSERQSKEKSVKLRYTPRVSAATDWTNMLAVERRLRIQPLLHALRSKQGGRIFAVCNSSRVRKRRSITRGLIGRTMSCRPFFFFLFC